MAKILVTGGCGFIGSHLVDRLIFLGHQPVILDDLSSGHAENVPQGVPVLVGDVSDPEVVALALSDVDCCVHLAAIASVEKSRRDWLGAHRVNLGGTLAVFECARRSRSSVPVVYASSAAVYGDSEVSLLAVGDPVRPSTPYGVDKLSCELFARVAGAIYSVPTFGLRFFNVYGPRQDPSSPYSGVISLFVDRLIRGLPVYIYGDGMQVRDFVFVNDVVDHLIAAIPKASCDAPVCNVCTGVSSSIETLLCLIAQELGREPSVVYAPPRPGDIRVSVGDASASERVLGVRSRTTLSEGLARTISDPGLSTRGAVVLRSPAVVRGDRP